MTTIDPLLGQRIAAAAGTKSGPLIVSREELRSIKSYLQAHFLCDPSFASNQEDMDPNKARLMGVDVVVGEAYQSHLCQP